MRILVVGGGGYLGGRLVRCAVGGGHEVVATYHSRPGQAESARWLRLDLTAHDEAAETIRELRPDAIVNAATREDDWATIALGPAHLALAAARSGAHLVQVSSDAIFSGRARHYDEDANPDPITPYGAAKAAAETAVRAIAPGATIARTSLIIGDGRSAHERLVHDLARGVTEGFLFTDDIRCPVHVDDLASALLELAVTRVGGSCHVAGADAISRYEMGSMIAQRDGLDPAMLKAARRTDHDVPGPVDVRLDSARTQAIVRTRLRGVREFLLIATHEPHPHAEP